MRVSFVARAATGSAALLALVLFGSPRAAVVVPEARADVAAPVCSVQGMTSVPRGTQIFDAASGGRLLGSFTGALLPVRMSSFPSDPTAGRAKVVTSLGSSALRIEGFAQPSAFNVYAARDVPVSAGHVWIASAQRVRLTQAGTSALTAELAVAGASGQTVRGQAGCDAFTLQRGTPRPIDVPGNGRVYSNKAAQLDLYDAPGGAAVLALRADSGTRYFWSTESRGNFVHVLARGDLVIDAWAPAGQLDAQKKGEMVDHVVPPSTSFAGAQLRLDGGQAPQIVVANRDVVVRSRRDDKEKPIGMVESGAEVYVMETVAGWTNILPKHLGFTAPSDGGFWIPPGEPLRK